MSPSEQQKFEVVRACKGLVIVDPPLDGERNMAIDEALLQNARPDWPIVLRIYKWDRPTLSLGHFQRIEDRNQYPRLSELPWVRRKTGGGAIVHDQEITYSVLLPNRVGLTSKGHNESLYRDIHLSFANMLSSLGWETGLSESCTCATVEQRNSEPFLCFLRRSPVDLIVGQDKILGSAQRRSKSGLLQHGSFLLRAAQSTPELVGLLETKRNLISFENLRDYWMNGASNIVLENKDTSSQADPWVELSIAAIAAGLAKRVDVEWQNGTMNDL